MIFFKKKKNSNDQNEVIYIQASLQANTSSSNATNELNLTDLNLDNLDIDILPQVNQIQHGNLVTFDSSKGIITINSDSPLSTQNLNQENFYNLLLKLQQSNQLELNNQSLTSQFYLSQEELNQLIADPSQQPTLNPLINQTNFDLDQAYLNSSPSIIPNYSINQLDQTTTFQMTNLQTNNEPPKCQELCCLLKFNASDDLVNLI